MTKRSARNRLLVFFLALSLVLANSAVLTFADNETGPDFTTGSSSIMVEMQLSGTSTNTHTRPERVWTKDDVVYAAVRSTHKMTRMFIGSVQSYDFIRFNELQKITVDAVELDPAMAPQLTGNAWESHWTVFLFHVADLISTGSGSYQISVESSEVGKGHWLVDASILITIPHVYAKVTKTWLGGSMDPIGIQLYKESPTTPRQTQGSLVTLTADANGKAAYTWPDLPYTDDFGNILVYTIEEVSGDSFYKLDTTDHGFTPDTSVAGLLGYYSWDLTNTYAETEVTGSKTWDDNDDQDGIRPDSLALTLFADGVEVSGATPTWEKTGDTWTYTFADLPAYAAGQEIIYSVEEEAVTGYDSDQAGNDFFNSHTPAETEIRGSKTWDDGDNQDGIRPESITVRLYANGTELSGLTPEWIKNGNTWTYTFAGLPLNAAGEEIVYTVKEDAVAGYESDQDDFDFTNSYEPELISITGTKTWIDNDNQDGVRPSGLIITLYADGTPVTSQPPSWKSSS